MQPSPSLAAWIDARGSRRDFARRVGCHETHLSNILQGKSGLSLELAVRIEDETAGEFTASRLLREHRAMSEGAPQ